MAANGGIQAEFLPPRKYFRADPIDNQRGEVEYKDRGLSFLEFEAEQQTELMEDWQEKQMNRITEENKQKFEALVQDIMTVQGAEGVAVAMVDKAGQVQYEKYFGYRDQEHMLPIDGQTIFGLASITKSFTSLAIMKLAEQGSNQFVGSCQQICAGFHKQKPESPC